MMNAGDFNCRVQIQRRVTGAKDAAGADTYTWTDLGMVYAKVTPGDASESEFGDQVVTRGRFTVRIRFAYGLITTEDRVLYYTKYAPHKTLEIDGIVDVDNRHEVLEISCSEQG